MRSAFVLPDATATSESRCATRTCSRRSRRSSGADDRAICWLHHVTFARRGDMRRITTSVLMLLGSHLVTACATARPGHWTERCDATPPANAVALTADRIPWLVGSFHLTLVTTSSETPPGRSEFDLFP